MHVPGDKATFDETRNTSRVMPVRTATIDAARKARERYQLERPEWYRWILAGRPELTALEYEYVRTKGRRGVTPTRW
jgi:hypothetical protein